MIIKQYSKVILSLLMGEHNPQASSKIQAKASQRLEFSSQSVRNKLNLDFITRRRSLEVKDFPFLITRNSYLLSK